MATRLKTLARCMSINKHKAMVMEYSDEPAALEAEQIKQQADLTKDVELVA